MDKQNTRDLTVADIEVADKIFDVKERNKRIHVLFGVIQNSFFNKEPLAREDEICLIYNYPTIVELLNIVEELLAENLVALDNLAGVRL